MKDLETKLKRLTADLEETKSEKMAMGQELAEVREKYRVS